MKLLRVIAVLFGLFLLPVSASAITMQPAPSIVTDGSLDLIKIGAKKAKADKKKAADEKAVKKAAAKKKKSKKKAAKKATKKKSKKASKRSKRRTRNVAGYKSCGKMKYRDKKTKKCVSAADKKA